MIFEKLEKEEKEAEEFFYGKPEETPVEGTPHEEKPIEEQPVLQQEEVKPEEDWKKRFTNFKATADNTIFKLRKENASLKSDVATLTERSDAILSELVELKKQISKKTKEDSFENLFTKEDEDLLGPEAIDVFKKAVKKVAPQEDNEELKSLKEEVKLLKNEKIKEYKRKQEDLEQETFGTLKDKLNNVVPDWQEVDTDPLFLKYLDEVDEIEGVTRKELFSSAVQSRRVRDVARFYQEYKSQRPLKKEEILSKKVTPLGSKGDSMDINKDTKKETYTMNEYVKFMDDITKGKYRGKEKEAKIIEAKFDRAFLDGRILD